MEIDACMCCFRPLPASRLLSQSTSLDSSTNRQSAETADRSQQEPEAECEPAPVIAPHPMQSPFEAPPLHSPFESPASGLPSRHQGPAVPEDRGHIAASSLVSSHAAISASTELTTTYDSRTGSSTDQVSIHHPCCLSINQSQPLN